MQLDIGAPPQFMDFRYSLDGPDYGEFWLDHCGALMDVEPMGDEFVVAMCHDIEDPTFDATAAASNARAQVRPIHRPPRTPTDRTPHCHWTVTIAEDHPALPYPELATALGETAAAGVELDDIGPADTGRSDYAGPLLADLRFEDFSRPALVRIAQEVCLQWHLLSLSFVAALRTRADSEDQAIDIYRRQFTGIAGLTAERLAAALELGTDLEAVAEVLELHPAFLPRAYVDLRVELTDRLIVHLSAGEGTIADGSWPTLIDADHTEPLDAIVRAVDARFRCLPVPTDPGAGAVAGDAGGAGLAFEVVMDDEPAGEAEAVVLTRFSTGADFEFSDRGTPVEISSR